MQMKCLMENTALSESYHKEHGLSLYMETVSHRILFDVGASHHFMENAEKMEVDLSRVDTVVVSHGHYDHGGGLTAFLKQNRQAKVWIHRDAFYPYHARKESGAITYVGLEPETVHNSALIQGGDHQVIDEELTLFAGVTGRRFFPESNRDLWMTREGKMVPDSFSHEQNLLITEQNRRVLIVGCAHNGILNILSHMESLGYEPPDVVVGGFHLYSLGRDESEPEETVRAIGETLKETGIQFYTCHCTGEKAYRELRDIMGEKMGRLQVGSHLPSV